MKNSTIIVGIVILLAVGGFLFLKSGNSSSTGNVINSGSNNNVQIVNMHVEGSQYVFEPSSVKKGIPVKLVADISRMPGCSKSVISSQLGISKTFTTNDNSVEFTPINSGSFNVACTMNMYRGSLTVL